MPITPGKVTVLILQGVSLVALHIGAASAHGLDEIERLFGGESIPTELVELTRELNATAGAKSIREQAHLKQHEILEQYIRAHTERICAEFLTSISRLDLEIVELQERGQHEEEQAKRKVRDDTAAFIAKSCSSTSLTQ
jgi:hypothetical protein